MKLLKYEQMDKTLIDSVIKICADEWGVSAESLKGKSRMQGQRIENRPPWKVTVDHIRPRWAAMWILHNIFKMTKVATGQAFNRDHTTVWAALDEIEIMMQHYSDKGLNAGFVEKFERVKDRSIQLILTEAA